MAGRRFWKMSGSGNDFIFFDARTEPAGALDTPSAIAALCERRTGVGADGVVFLEPHARYAFLMRYLNRDGSLAEMCGNAALCTVRLARELGIVGDDEFAFETTSGPVTARFVRGLPEVDMIPVTELEPAFATDMAPGELRIGYARVGVPHLVVQVADLAGVDVVSRGRQLRGLWQLRDGANANFVAPRRDGAGWEMRTYERGVEEETLACGTGAVAAVAILTAWGLVRGDADLTTRSGRQLRVTVPTPPREGAPTLGGEGRIVFEGTLGDFVQGLGGHEV